MDKVNEYRLDVPLNEEVVRSLKVKDIIYFNGAFFTARSLFHIRAVQQNIIPPVPFDQINLMLHAGPVMARTETGWRAISIEPTTSMRMEKYESLVIEKLGLRAIIGKSTMGRKTLEALKRFGCVHLSKIGIYGSVLASKVSKVIDVHYIDELGPIECTWVMEAKDFGPFFVDMDTHGNNFYAKIQARARRRLEEVHRRFSIPDKLKYVSED